MERPSSSPTGFFALIAQPYRGRALWPFAVSFPVLIAYIAYGWRTQTPLESLHWLPETVGGVVLLANGVYALALFCRASVLTLKSMTLQLEIVDIALKESRGKRTAGDPALPKLSAGQRLRILMPIAQIFSHLGLMLFFFVPSSLLVNAPYLH